MSDVGDAILDGIVAPGRPRLAGRTVVVLAHPDDETLGCGALLPRLPDLTIVHVTTGAPNDDAAREHGFPHAAAYAEARRRELEAALAAGGVTAGCLCLGIPDQRVAFELAPVARQLRPILRGAEFVLTHAFEGGHPDHDATAFAVWLAVREARTETGRPVCLEMPFYSAGPDDGWRRQLFADGDADQGRVLALTGAERALKTRMMAAFTSQRGTLDAFGAGDERYRLAAPPDLGKTPNGGQVLYERYPWGMTSRRLAELARAAETELASESMPA